MLTAAIHTASDGDAATLSKIEKRSPPMEVVEGDMCTQTNKIQKNRKKVNGQGFVGSARDLYHHSRAKAFDRIVGRDSKKCEIPIKELQEFFEGTTAETNVPQKVLKEMGSRLPNLEEEGHMKLIDRDFTESEVMEAYKKTKDTAPGVDGLRYQHLKQFDPGFKMLTLLYNECKKHRKIPSHWKEAETVLLYKGGDESKPDNWRPISLMPTIYKLYSSLWNRRIRSVEKVMSACQRGFQEREGCAESIGILKTAIDVAKGKKRSLSVAWLDLTNAFGSVPHELIASTLEAYGFPEEIREIVKDMYNGASMRIKTSSEKSDQIMIKSGVKQGDPISPTLFNMCLENVIRRHLDTAKGHRCINTRVKVLAFADDMAILAESRQQLQEELEKLDKECEALNLIFKPAKCASLIIEQGHVHSSAKIMLRDKPIRNLSNKDSYKYLGGADWYRN
uniref:Reverse transcriptase domain-containing protein n=1 Tax=Caenorhabditis tropicalis TaxID=1561998 RepID=A0A1I7UTR1_9PELO